MSKAQELAKKQLECYNNHDLEGFLSAYHDDTKIYNVSDGALIMEGKEAMRQRYGELFKNKKVHAKLVNRMVFGNKAIDHESVTRGDGNPPTEVAAIYEVEDGLIKTVWFVRSGE